MAAGEPITPRNSSEKDVAAGAIFDSSISHRSPGASRKSCSDLNASDLGWRTSVTSPPVVYAPSAAAGCGTLTTKFFLPLETSDTASGPAAFRPSIPLTSENVTTSPSSRSRSSSSTVCTRSLVVPSFSSTTTMCSTIALLMLSPVGSAHVNCSPRSTKTPAASPRTSARMKAIGGDAARQAASARSASSRERSIATTAVKADRSVGNAPVAVETATPGLSSCICCTQASARFLPASAGER